MNIHKEGAPIITISLVFALILGGSSFYFGAHPVLCWILTLIPVGFAVFFMCFFRNPKRTPAGDAHRITAPADGTVVIIQEVEEPEYFHDRRLQISVFMSFFNVHVNWAPVTGIISFSVTTEATTSLHGIPSPPPRTRGPQSYSAMKTARKCSAVRSPASLQGAWSATLNTKSHSRPESR